MLDDIKRIWAGEPRGYAGAIGPSPLSTGGPPLLIGGLGDIAVRRTVQLGDGWITGEGTPADFKHMSEKVDAAWSAAGREGSPRLTALCYFALGEGADATAAAYLRDYYAWLGDPPDIALNVAVTPSAARPRRRRAPDK
jgi:alkanesulfonate monooxygenase SsuD/methylene tetrahydromethanopterin reductase-like flavin-dependent oxidoreductase (luciferase family)